jgi:hypothetical protein
VATGSTISYPNPWRTIKVNNDFTEWQINTEYVTSIPSMSDVNATCRKRLNDNLKGGLGWHINDAWSSLDKYRDATSALGLTRQFIPETPEELTEILTKYLGDQMSKVYMIHNEGNEWENPEAAGLEEQLMTNVEKMLRDRAKTLGIADTQADLLIMTVKTLYSLRFEAGLKSMLTDINQFNNPDKRLESRTDDLNAVLRLGR